jgi:hypothetical protein
MAQNVRSAEDFIPLDDIRMPSNDLIHEGRILTAEEAYELSHDPISPLNLTNLNPQISEIWENETIDILSENVDNLAVKDGAEVIFKSNLASNMGLYRFNIKVAAETGPSSVMTVHLDKKLHTYLLRKNVLRKLGYKIPAMKYLKKLVVKFKTKEEKEKFIKREIPENTLGTYKRWVVKGLDSEGEPDESLSVTIQDVMVTKPNLNDHYNVALGVPPKSLTSRTLRSLIIPYSAFNVAESVNKLNWIVGHIDNRNIKLPHDTLADFNATMDDAKWMLNRFLKLKRRDFHEIVKLAYFPISVEKLILEKLITRRNALSALFEMNTEDLFNDTEISFGENLKKGRLEKVEYEGYASHFAHGSPDSPFDDWGWAIFDEVQSAGIDELISRANNELRMFDLSSARSEHLAGQFQNGLEHFIETGEFLEQSVGAWVSPIVNGQVILSRNIVVGNYMGTDNLVQLADTFGYGVRVGVQVGFDGFGLNYGASTSATLNYVKTYSHLKPVKRLRDSMKEPYKNMVVPIVKHMIRKQADRLATFEQDTADATDEEKDEVLNEIVKTLDKYLGVGESLITTERLAPTIMASGRISYSGTSVSLGLSTEGLLIKRVHLHRKDGNTIQVYVDNGKSLGIGVSFKVDNLIPILEVRYKRTAGKYKVNAYTLNLDTDADRNPDLMRTAAGLSHLIRKGSAELLDDISRPYSISNKFVDESIKAKLFHWRHKTLRQSDMFSILTPKYKETNYVKYSKASQMGINYRAFLTDIVNYYLGKYVNGLRINGDTWKNPGQTYFGVAKTTEARFEGRLLPQEDEILVDVDSDEDGEISEHEAENYELNEKDTLLKRDISAKFLSLTHRKEGWNISRKKLFKEVKEWNDKYKKKLFADNTLKDATALKLYNFSMNVNVYEQGIENIKNLSQKKLETIQRKYKRRLAFTKKCKNIRYRNKVVCGNLKTIISESKKCKSELKKNNATKSAKCILNLTQTLEKSLEFEDFKEIVGIRNLYIYGQINGFRKDSETLIKPINSNTIGNIASRHWNGPIEGIRDILGLQSGEFNGSWMRETLR